MSRNEISTSSRIKEDLVKLPELPGVYIMRDQKDTIIYVGKAKSLRKRVQQYFRKSHDEGVKKNQMVSIIDHFEYIVTDTEMEALVLENNLIKEHRPKYNTLLRDDKTYPYIKVTVNEEYPRVYMTRSVSKDKARYYGPFTSAKSVKDTIELIQKICKLRTCNNKFPDNIGKVKPCLNYHIHQCKGVCCGGISKDEYRERINRALDFLDGDFKSIVEMLNTKMQEASENLEFEQAAEYRDLIESVKFCIQKQKITDTNNEDRDVIAIVREGEDAVAQIFFIRDGKLIGRDHFFITARVEEKREELTRAFIHQFYSGTPYIPRDILVQDEIVDAELTMDWLSAKRGKKVYIITPKKGQKERLVELAQKNAKLILSKNKEAIKREEARTVGAVKEIAQLLGLDSIRRIEAYDISNISGFNSVGSMVVFEKGKPHRNDYRKFKIKTVSGPNDYASMEEVLTRRFTHVGKAAENDSFDRLPDLIMMDGGKGQVNIALKVLDKLNLNINVCGMVKDDHHHTRGLFFKDNLMPIDKNSEGFKLITRVQDEAHRFAIEYHRSLRSKGQVKSFLDDIAGIGPQRRKALMRHFSGAEEMSLATVEEISKIPSMDMRSAQAICDYFHKENQET